jgi:hypothetical protein
VAVLTCLLIIAGCQTNTQPQATPKKPVTAASVPEPATAIEPSKTPLVIHLDITTPQPANSKPRYSAIDLAEDKVAIIPKDTIVLPQVAMTSTLPAPQQQPDSMATDHTEVATSIAPVAPSIDTPPESDIAKPSTLNQINPAEQQQQLLDLADSMLAAGHIDLSLNLLQQINIDLLPQASWGHYLESMATGYLLTGDSYTALQWLDQAQTLDPAPDQASHKKRLALLQKAYTNNEQFLQAALSAMALTDGHDPENNNSVPLLTNNNMIWNLLMQVPKQQLRRHLQSSPPATTKAWLELALSTHGLINIDLQQQAIMVWQVNNPLHPAAVQLPTALSELVDLQPRQTQKLALLLPTSGPLSKIGQAVIDGFMANYYAAMSQCKKPCTSLPQLVFINSHTIQDWQQFYTDMENQQIDLIIGPLDKSRVDRIHNLKQRNIPTLALNFLSSDNDNLTLADKAGLDSQLSQALLTHLEQRIPDQPIARKTEQPTLFQFSPSVEDEARQLATRGYHQGLRQALIIQANSRWAQRASDAFQQQWQALGGQVTGQISYSGDGDHADSISKVLLTDNSKERRRALQKTIAENVRFEPRRRQDVDLVLILALPEDARQLMPTLAFHHAADITVYSTHHAYQGPTESTRDRDLNRMYFSDIPWMLEPDVIADQVAGLWPNRQRYSRLFALGADAFLLYPRLQQMQIFNTTRVQGMTGLLSLDDQDRITANLTWARFQRGQPKVQSQ